MSEFKIGDRVLAVDNVGMYKTPAPGTVISVYSKFSHPYRVHFDGSGYKLWSNVAGLLREKHPVIVITTDGKTTTATKRLGKTVLGTATARCNPGDKFDFDIGAALAFARLVGAEVKFAEEEKPKLLNGKFVCVKAGFPLWWTKGKIYEVKDGIIRDDEGDDRGPYKDLDDLHRNIASNFIPLVED